ncbi:sensor histidine kinase [Nocardioides sp. InS609-2]|uniref:sensor histidine kinase n=1 Tax=Nocardioides sp. InS609-2 TaxID=2760705 RepID=UPI0020BDBEA7|nr:sensor histidine kinase [Nocardioides sp. InS609-2]
MHSLQDGRWHYRRSLASRVALLTTLAVGLSVAAVALVGYLTVRMQMQSTLDESLLGRAEAVASSGALSRITQTVPIPSEALGAADIRIIFINEQGNFRSADDLPPLALGRSEVDVAAGKTAHSIRTISAAGDRWRVVTVPTEPGQAIVVAQSLQPQILVLRKLGLVLTFFGIAGVVAAGFAGWGVARNGLRPVRRLTDAVEDIARTEQLTPLAVEGDDEVARLATSFNQMLMALSASRDRQRQLVADAGHELRTPLTSLRTNIDLLTQAGDGLPAAARTELMSDVRAQTEELTTLVGDLVELARDEPIDHVVERIDLAEVTERAVARVRRRAPAATFDVVLEPWPVRGESAALERAVTNLLDNAAKWSPPDGTITVRLDDGVLTVDDQGSGISDNDLPHVFERFYRSEESRSMPGSGLGLSIVRQVVERHSGAVRADASPTGGARVSMWLPAASA